ncbi:imidazole glycerol phosphate synthase hisHF [Blastocladiella britannica]|nr:imidazole glycerol phosphate synthase hisHF [Blastocladiella britannica]
MASVTPRVFLLDYGAGNVRSLCNAVQHATGIDLVPIRTAAEFALADIVVFPGVGAFGQAVSGLRALGFVEPLLAYLRSGKPFFGICVGMQSLFAASEEDPGAVGLGVIPVTIRKFSSATKVVPHMGWNAAPTVLPSALAIIDPHASYYFVHSYAAIFGSVESDDEVLARAACATSRYGDQVFTAAVRFRNIFATQFHPEKSGPAGLQLLRDYFATAAPMAPLPDRADLLPGAPTESQAVTLAAITATPDRLAKRIIACLDIRANDAGELVVTKGQGYDVRDTTTSNGGDVRNLGDPVVLASRYYSEGADEIAFLNIMSFRSVPIADLPMLHLLERASATLFVPLTIGGGIRDIPQPNGAPTVRALDVVAAYFRAGADKVSIGSDAVAMAESLWAERGNGAVFAARRGTTAIEQIAAVYGSQALVVSVDPRRVYVSSPTDTTHTTIPTAYPGPNGEGYCWYECTIKGGREARDLDVVQLVTACEYLGAGEVLLNCMDKDGSNSGFDLELTAMVKRAVRIPVVASSGAGAVEHFSEVFSATGCEAALAAGIFHRKEVPIESVKAHLAGAGVLTRS